MDNIVDIIHAIGRGEMAIILDDEDRENEGDLVMAAPRATAESLAFYVRHTSGIICMPMTAERLEALQLPQMVSDNTDAHKTAFTVSVDYRHGNTTGISAADRARTIRALADPASRPGDFTRPGHIFPLRAAAGGVLTRAGHTEASVDLVRLGGLSPPAAIISELINDDGGVKRGDELFAFAREHNIRIGTIADLIRHRMEQEKTVRRVGEQEVCTEFGPFRLISYEETISGRVHFALVKGVIDAQEPVLVRVQVPNWMTDVLGVQGNATGWPLRDALRRIAREGGVAVVLRLPEDSGELMHQLKRLDAGETSDWPVPATHTLRTFGVGAQVLADLGVKRMRVLSAPKKMHAIAGFGLEVEEYVEPEQAPAAVRHIR